MSDLTDEMRGALAAAWDAGHTAGAMWDYTEHREPEFSPDANPYRQEGESKTLDSRGSSP